MYISSIISHSLGFSNTDSWYGLFVKSITLVVIRSCLHSHAPTLMCFWLMTNSVNTQSYNQFRWVLSFDPFNFLPEPKLWRSSRPTITTGMIYRGSFFRLRIEQMRGFLPFWRIKPFLPSSASGNLSGLRLNAKSCFALTSPDNWPSLKISFSASKTPRRIWGFFFEQLPISSICCQRLPVCACGGS